MRTRGTIRQRGHHFEIRIDLGLVDGKRQRRSIAFKGDYKAAQKELTRLLEAADGGTLPDPTRMTVAEYARGFLDSSVTQSPKTIERYKELCERQVVPHLGAVKLQRLRPEHLERWHSELLESGLAARTIGHAHRLLSLVLTRAVQNGVLSRNVASIRRPPKCEDTEIEILQPADAAAVLAGLAGHPLHPIAVLALGTGARRGELLALEWRNVDLDRGVVRIERSVEETKAGLRVKPPKTRAGRRNVGLAPETIAGLRDHRRRQLELRLQLGQGGQPSLVFSDVSGNLLSPDNLSRDWRRVCDARKLPAVSFHGLRHTHVSMLIRAKVDILTISRRIGHRKVSVTLDIYGHLIEGADAEAAAAIEGVWK